MQFQHMFVLYPGSINVFDRLGDTYRKTEQYDLSLEYYQKFLEIEPANPRVLGIIEQINKLDHKANSFIFLNALLFLLQA